MKEFKAKIIEISKWNYKKKIGTRDISKYTANRLLFPSSLLKHMGWKKGKVIFTPKNNYVVVTKLEENDSKCK